MPTAAQCGVRPEHVKIGSAEADGLRGTVLLAEYAGAETLLHIQLENGDVCLALHRDDVPPQTHSEVTLTAEPDRIYYFDENGVALQQAR